MKSPLSHISQRERVMLAALLIVGALIWGSLFMKRWGRVNEELREARRETEMQRVWLRSIPQFEAQRQKVLSELDKSKTYNASQLVGWFDGVARDHKLRHTLSAPKVTSDNIFIHNSLPVILRNISIEQLLSVENQIRVQHPYLSMDDLSIRANPADQRLLNVNFTLNSFEIR